MYLVLRATDAGFPIACWQPTKPPSEMLQADLRPHSRRAPANAQLLAGAPLNYAPLNRPMREPRAHRRPSQSRAEPDDRATRKANNNRYKTELCRPFGENGTCKYAEKCQFAHGLSELRNVPRHPKYKTEKCKTFHTTGLCPYGPRCHFVHNNRDEASEAPHNDHLSFIAAHHPIILSLAQTQQRHQLQLQALPSSSSSWESSGPSTGSASPSGFSSSDEGEAMSPAVDLLASELERLWAPQPQPKRLPVFSRLSSAVA